MADLWTVGTPFPGEPGEWGPFSRLPDFPIAETLLFNLTEMQIPDRLTVTQQEVWQKIILDQLLKSKLVVVFLNQFYSEETWHNYAFLPPQCNTLVAHSGRDLQLANHPILRPLWDKISPYLHYSCVFENTVTLSIPLAMSKSTKKVAAGIQKISRGKIILLPEINWLHSNLIQDDTWTPKALDLGRYINTYFVKAAPHFKNL